MQTTERSKTDWQHFRELERKRHNSFFLPQYERLNMEVVEDISNDTQTNPYDVLVRYKGSLLKVEEKTRTKIWDHLLVEVMQCLRSGRVGWIYNKDIHYLFDTMWKSEQDEEPEVAYLVQFPKLKDFVIENFDKLPSGTSSKGYGLTYFKKAAWHDLEYLKIAQRVL